jgi:hypothetical protein
MAANVKLSKAELRQIRITMELHSSLHKFMCDLARRILHAAAQRAWALKTDARPVRISSADIAQGARPVLTKVASELERAMREHEAGHVRNAS